MMDLVEELQKLLGTDTVLPGEEAGEDYAHDEALTATPRRPAVVVMPTTTEDVSRLLRFATETGTPVTARGSGTGLCGSAIPAEGGILVSFERMNRILEIDEENHVAVVQPGVTLQELDEQTARRGLVYPVYPGEYSASIGGNVSTNAGGMRAVKYGVTRHQVLGLEAVLATGEVIRTGGKFVKATTGYDLTQLIVGSEGTLALVTEAILRLYPRPSHQATVLAPFATLDEITAAIPKIVVSGLGPFILEYIDLVTMAATTANIGLDLGIPDEVRDKALAYLVVAMENQREDRLEEDLQQLCELLGGLGAMDVYVLPSNAATRLIEAREKAFWIAKAHGADDIIDVVVPRASIPEYMRRVSEIAQRHGALVGGCGHAGDGNVHLAVFQKEPEKLHAVMRDILSAGMELGGTISAEHGIGTEKKPYFLELEDPNKIELMRRIKRAFDPAGILNPGKLFD